MVKRVLAKVSPAALVWLGSAALNATLWALSLSVFPAEESAVILHYSVGVGIDFIGQGQQINLLPAFGLALMLFNGLLVRMLRRHEPLTASVIRGTTPLVQIILLVAFV